MKELATHQDGDSAQEPSDGRGRDRAAAKGMRITKAGGVIPGLIRRSARVRQESKPPEKPPPK